MKPSTKSYKDIVKIIQDELYTKGSTTAERYTFSFRVQYEHESIGQYKSGYFKEALDTLRIR